MVVRSSRPRRSRLQLGAAAALLVLAVAVVALWPVGPILLLATEHHGLHLGDVLALAPATAVTAKLLRSGRSWRHSRPHLRHVRV